MVLSGKFGGKTVSCGIYESKLQYRIDITVRNMTNSQKRKLYKLMLESGIREWKEE